MEQSMSDQLKMSYQPSLLNLTDVTFSQGSGSGITHSPEPDGGTVTGRCGQDRALASLSPRQAKEMGLLTSGTYGLRGSTLSSSADLASSLASRFRAKTRSLGSTLFTLIWKVRYTPSGRPIFAVRASGLRTSGRDCTSWPTPRSMDGEIGESLETWEVRRDKKAAQKINLHKPLSIVAQMTTWRSQSASDGEGGVMEIRPETAGKYKPRDEAELAMWQTPKATDHSARLHHPERSDGGQPNLAYEANRAAWPTPCQQDGPKGGPNQAVHLTATWPTPAIADTGVSETARQGGENLSVMAQLTDSGEMPSGSIAATGNGVLSGQLNPGHSRWLMSLPIVWDLCALIAAHNKRKK